MTISSPDCAMITLTDVFKDLGLEPPRDLDVKISGYIIPKFFGRKEAAVEARRLAQTFTFDTPR